MITILHRGGYGHKITILHREGGSTETPKMYYVIYERPLMRNMHEKDEVASATDVDRLAIGNETTTAFFNAR